MDLLEISAEKIRAGSGRARYRDFYDLYLIITDLGVSFAEALGLLKLKEIREPISQQAMLRNWTVAREQQSRDLRIIYCAREVGNQEIQAFVKGLMFDPIMTSGTHLRKE